MMNCLAFCQTANNLSARFCGLEMKQVEIGFKGQEHRQ
jgi:hypothetical protein